jgi:hypothetical protein
MLRSSVRLALILLGIAAAIILFAFAFTAAAIVVAVGIVALALFGRPPRITWTVVRQSHSQGDEPLIIEHDPNEQLRTRERD